MMNKVQTVFREIGESCPQFKEALRIYSTSFSPVQTRPIERITAMLRNDRHYHLHVAMLNNVVVGISLLYVFPSLRIGLVDYMAIAQEHRRRGFGSELFKYSLDRFQVLVSNPVGLLLEVQEPSVGERRERSIREERLRFYSRLGVRLLSGVQYLMPPQHGTEPERLYLMIFPIAKQHSLPKETVLEYVKAIHVHVYQYENNDLLTATASTLPRSVMIAEVPLSSERTDAAPYASDR
jgi:GNAT superfamily N-acetyltransferase